MTTRTITNTNLAGLAADLLSQGTRIIAPALATDGLVDYRWIERFEDALPGGALPRRSLKEFLLPPTEPLLAWKQSRDQVHLREVPVTFGPRVVIGARPCDAAALEVLDRVMNWDYRDELWFGRREATTIVTMACPGVDESCFCTAVGLAPDTSKGSDLLLIPVAQDYHVEVLTSKGEALIAAHETRFGPGGDAAAATAFRGAAHDRVSAHLRVNPDGIRTWLQGHFEHPLWDAIALRCHGCGACAAVCPTCHCFDIVDEPDSVTTGVRRRNWDTCQTGRFTLHASGHNPRHDQCARFRQRIMHKFMIYPSRFEEILCTGCGRCSRVCPGGQDLPEVLAQIDGLVNGAASDGGTP